jgi:hypothetical protein
MRALGALEATLRPSARCWAKRRWWASPGRRPQIRHGFFGHAIHSPQEWASTVVRLTIPAVWSPPSHPPVSVARSRIGEGGSLLVERIRMGGDLHPLSAPRDHRRHRCPRRHDPHVMLQAEPYTSRRRAPSENGPGQHEFGSKIAPVALGLATIRLAGRCQNENL